MFPGATTYAPANAVLDSWRPFTVFVVLLLIGWSCRDCIDSHRFMTSKHQLAKIHVDKIARELYPRWAAENPDRACTTDLLAIGRAVYPDFTQDDFYDPWGGKLAAYCWAGQLHVYSLGPDHVLGTADDVRSWARSRR